VSKLSGFSKSMLVALILIVISMISSVYFASVKCDLGMWLSLAVFVLSAFSAVCIATSKMYKSG